jgi:uncharacterized membrane protein
MSDMCLFGAGIAFLTALASTAADWLQGPYVYSLYREQYGMPERMVAFLFVTGFMSAGLTAPLVGVWADQQCVSRLYWTHSL